MPNSVLNSVLKIPSVRMSLNALPTRRAKVSQCAITARQQRIELQGKGLNSYLFNSLLRTFHMG